MTTRPIRHALITGAFRFPDGDAAAFRMQGIATLLAEAGFKVTMAGWEGVSQEEKFYRFEDIECYPQDELRDGRAANPIARLIGFLFRGRNTAKWLLRRKHCFDVVVVYNPPAAFAGALLLLARMGRFNLVLDSTEWYEGEHLPGGCFGPAALENWLRMRLIYPLYSHVICISALLEAHFRGSNTLRLPPFSPPILSEELADTRARREALLSRRAVHFVYAGQAGRKDRLLEFIRALPSLASSLDADLHLHLAGVGFDEAIALADDGESLQRTCSELVTFHGRISREQVFSLYKRCHFSVFFRENKRYARAGFPTKAVESWAHGCPVVTNAIGDVSIFAENGKECVFVDEAHLHDHLAASLGRLIEPEAWGDASEASVSLANRAFALDANRASFRRFIQHLS